MLALENLLYFSETHPSGAQYILAESNSQLHQFFFCCAGIYITLEVWKLTKDDECDELWQYCRSTQRALVTFGEIYSILFESFNTYWIRHPEATMMNFNKIIIEFFEKYKKECIIKIKKAVKPMLIEDYMKFKR